MSNNLRDQIPALKNKYYFNYGGQGPKKKKRIDKQNTKAHKNKQLIRDSKENKQKKARKTTKIWV